MFAACFGKRAPNGVDGANCENAEVDEEIVMKLRINSVRLAHRSAPLGYIRRQKSNKISMKGNDKRLKIEFGSNAAGFGFGSAMYQLYTRGLHPGSLYSKPSAMSGTTEVATVSNGVFGLSGMIVYIAPVAYRVKLFMCNPQKCGEIVSRTLVVSEAEYHRLRELQEQYESSIMDAIENGGGPNVDSDDVDEELHSLEAVLDYLGYERGDAVTEAILSMEQGGYSPPESSQDSNESGIGSDPTPDSGRSEVLSGRKRGGKPRMNEIENVLYKKVPEARNEIAAKMLERMKKKRRLSGGSNGMEKQPKLGSCTSSYVEIESAYGFYDVLLYSYQFECVDAVTPTNPSLYSWVRFPSTTFSGGGVAGKFTGSTGTNRTNRRISFGSAVKPESHHQKSQSALQSMRVSNDSDSVTTPALGDVERVSTESVYVSTAGIVASPITTANPAIYLYNTVFVSNLKIFSISSKCGVYYRSSPANSDIWGGNVSPSTGTGSQFYIEPCMFSATNSSCTTTIPVLKSNALQEQRESFRRCCIPPLNAIYDSIESNLPEIDSGKAKVSINVGGSGRFVLDMLHSAHTSSGTSILVQLECSFFNLTIVDFFFEDNCAQLASSGIVPDGGKGAVVGQLNIYCIDGLSKMRVLLQYHLATAHAKTLFSSWCVLGGLVHIYNCMVQSIDTNFYIINATRMERTFVMPSSINELHHYNSAVNVVAGGGTKRKLYESPQPPVASSLSSGKRRKQMSVQFVDDSPFRMDCSSGNKPPPGSVDKGSDAHYPIPSINLNTPKIAEQPCNARRNEYAMLGLYPPVWFCGESASSNGTKFPEKQLINRFSLTPVALKEEQCCFKTIRGGTATPFGLSLRCLRVANPTESELDCSVAGDLIFSKELELICSKCEERILRDLNLSLHDTSREGYELLNSFLQLLPASSLDKLMIPYAAKIEEMTLKNPLSNLNCHDMRCSEAHCACKRINGVQAKVIPMCLIEAGKRCMFTSVRVQVITSCIHNKETHNLVKLTVSGSGLDNPIEVYVDLFQWQEEYEASFKNGKPTDCGVGCFSSYCTGESFGSNSNSHNTFNDNVLGASGDIYDLFCSEFNLGASFVENSPETGGNCGISIQSQSLKLYKLIWMKKSV